MKTNTIGKPQRVKCISQRTHGVCRKQEGSFAPDYIFQLLIWEMSDGSKRYELSRQLDGVEPQSHIYKSRKTFREGIRRWYCTPVRQWETLKCWQDPWVIIWLRRGENAEKRRTQAMAEREAQEVARVSQDQKRAEIKAALGEEYGVRVHIEPPYDDKLWRLRVERTTFEKGKEELLLREFETAPAAAIFLAEWWTSYFPR